jgi:hypothetical protein
MIANVLLPEAGDFVELILPYQSADIRKIHCLSFRKDRAAPDWVSRLSQALVAGKFF